MNDVTQSRTEIQKLIALSYYDGPTGGLVLLSLNGRDRTFIFELVAWDDSQDRRIFAMCEIEDQTALERLAKVAGPPKWPIWVPDWKLRSSDEQAKADEAVSRLMELKIPYHAIMCASDSMSSPVIWIDLDPSHKALLSQFEQSKQLQPFQIWNSSLCGN